MATRRKKTEKRVTYEVERWSDIWQCWLMVPTTTTRERADEVHRALCIRGDLSRIVKVTREVVR